jgi:hypothetical protein
MTPASGFPHLLTGITTSTLTALSSLRGLNYPTAVRLLKPCATVPAFMNSPANVILVGGLGLNALVLTTSGLDKLASR